MRRVAFVLTAALTVLALHAPVATTAPVADSLLSPDGRLHELTLDSPALGTTTQVRVLLPASYDDPSHATHRYPVLYLLHGAGDDYRAWNDKTGLARYTAPLDLIVVMPDGGRGGFYSDWRNGPAWESFHIGELIGEIDTTYRTLAQREGRAIGGLSMGGFGALSYAARHPDLFVAAASFSGAVDTAVGENVEAAGFELLHGRFNTPNDDVWGPYETSEVNWRAHNPTDLRANLRSLYLRLATGNGLPVGDDQPNGAPIEAAVYLLNTWFHLQLDGSGIAHDWLPRLHGTHEWSYWDADLAGWLPPLMGVFAAPPPRPEVFDYTSAEPDFSVWGWDVTSERAVQEFMTLHGVGAGGLQVTGSGLAHVVTPPVYAPGVAHTVTATTADGVHAVRYDLIAGADGRLSFTVDLGPSHAAPQYSLDADLTKAVADLSGGYFRTVTVSIAPA